MKVFSLVGIYEALGFPPEVSRTLWPTDVSPEQIAAKVIHPELAIQLGGERSVPLLSLASYCANLLDAFFETGSREFLIQADHYWRQLVGATPSTHAGTLLNRARSACTFFYYERDLSQRIARGERLLQEEVPTYFLRRGSDAPLYAALLEVDGIRGPAITTAFQAFQGLWDLADDIRDLDQDRKGLGVNVLLLGFGEKPALFKTLADSLAEQGTRADVPRPLRLAVEQQYARTSELLV